jgi:hypothetical protein
MAGYSVEIGSRLLVRVLEPVATALKVAEAMVGVGIAHSKPGLFSNPRP